MNADNQLLESYARHGSEAAFRELVERHINLVHSAAMREAGNEAALAEDITQAVFTELARCAPKLLAHPSIAGWLYTCVRHMAANVRRAEHRRHRREQEAFTMNELLGSDPADKLWQQVRPVLDDVMHELQDDDRAAVLMRFFEGRSFKEVGQSLGLTENAARMRVERSLEKLHGLLSRRGVKSTASTLAAVVAAGAVLSAPAGLAATIATGALTAAALTTPTLFGLTKLMSMTNLKIAGAGVLLAVAAAFAVWHPSRAGQTSTASIVSAQAIVAPPSETAVKPVAQNISSAGAILATNAVEQMPLQILDAETGKPLAQAKVLLAYLRNDGRGKDVRLVTDAQGRLPVDFPQAPFHMINMFVTSEGHVPKVTTLARTGEMPASYTMKLDRGMRIGGVVVDEAGQPISGARLEFDYPGGNNMALAENIQFGPDAVSQTDTDGRWLCTMMPKDLDHIEVKVTHAEHAEATAEFKLDAADLNNFSVTMPAGYTVSGTVQDTSGNPIADAKIRTVRMNSEGEQSHKTDTEGQFAFKCIPAGELILSVQAKGFAADSQTLQVSARVSDVHFQLGPGRLLRGRVVDETGNPIAGAYAETLREATRRYVWSAKTDLDGRFAWDSAPVLPIRYSFQAEGYDRGFALELTADGTEHVITLARVLPGKDSLQISGTAVDADSGQPLAAFSVQQRQAQPDWAPPFGFATDGKDGQFKFTSPTGALHTNYQLEIKSEGYQPAVSGILNVADGNQKLEFKLQKGAGPAGVVLLPTGEPAVGATVLLCTSESGVVFGGAGEITKGINTTVFSAKTDRAGKFSLPPVFAPAGLVAVHENGYAELSLADCEANGGILLHAWGGIAGTLILDGQPAANETIFASAQECRYDDTGRRFGFVTVGREVHTDAAGKFSIDGMPPGAFRVFRSKRLNGDWFASYTSHQVTAVVTPGKVTQVTLGGTGRPVTGTVTLPGAASAIVWQRLPVLLISKAGTELGPRPRRPDFASNEAYIKVMDQWIEAMNATLRYGAFCDSNGAFRVQDVPAGTYQMKIVLQDPNREATFPNPHMGPESEIASLTRDVVVEAEQNNAALDLGTLELTPRTENVAAH